MKASDNIKEQRKAIKASDRIKHVSVETNENDENKSKENEARDFNLQHAIEAYNSAYTELNDVGVALFLVRERSVDLIEHIEVLINSISCWPKSFEADISEITINKAYYKDDCEFARQELKAARDSVIGAGAGVASGIAVASLAPTAAMWVATTFGTASTGTAISTLSGAAATNAALAWLGGGAMIIGGKGMAAGKALLALAGPVGWGTAGVSILASIVLFAGKKHKVDAQKKKEIEAILHNTEAVKETSEKVEELLSMTMDLRNNLSMKFEESLCFYNSRYLELSEENRYSLGTLVNNTKTLSALLERKL